MKKLRLIIFVLSKFFSLKCLGALTVPFEDSKIPPVYKDYYYETSYYKDKKKKYKNLSMNHKKFHFVLHTDRIMRNRFVKNVFNIFCFSHYSNTPLSITFHLKEDQSPNKNNKQTGTIVTFIKNRAYKIENVKTRYFPSHLLPFKKITASMEDFLSFSWWEGDKIPCIETFTVRTPRVVNIPSITPLKLSKSLEFYEQQFQRFFPYLKEFEIRSQDYLSSVAHPIIGSYFNIPTLTRQSFKTPGGNFLIYQAENMKNKRNLTYLNFPYLSLKSEENYPILLESFINILENSLKLRTLSFLGLNLSTEDFKKCMSHIRNLKFLEKLIIRLPMQARKEVFYSKEKIEINGDSLYKSFLPQLPISIKQLELLGWIVGDKSLHYLEHFKNLETLNIDIYLGEGNKKAHDRFATFLKSLKYFRYLNLNFFHIFEDNSQKIIEEIPLQFKVFSDILTSYKNSLFDSKCWKVNLELFAKEVYINNTKNLIKESIEEFKKNLNHSRIEVRYHSYLPL